MPIFASEKLYFAHISSDIRENSRRFLKEFFDRLTYKVYDDITA